MNKREAAELRHSMRAVFLTADGRKVLKFLMKTCNAHRLAVDEQDRILQNAFKRILFALGAVGNSEEDIEAQVSAWCGIANANRRDIQEGGMA